MDFTPTRTSGSHDHGAALSMSLPLSVNIAVLQPTPYVDGQSPYYNVYYPSGARDASSATVTAPVDIQLEVVDNKEPNRSRVAATHSSFSAGETNSVSMPTLFGNGGAYCGGDAASGGRGNNGRAGPLTYDCGLLPSFTAVAKVPSSTPSIEASSSGMLYPAAMSCQFVARQDSEAGRCYSYSTTVAGSASGAGGFQGHLTEPGGALTMMGPGGVHQVPSASQSSTMDSGFKFPPTPSLPLYGPPPGFPAFAISFWTPLEEFTKHGSDDGSGSDSSSLSFKLFDISYPGIFEKEPEGELGLLFEDQRSVTMWDIDLLNVARCDPLFQCC